MDSRKVISHILGGYMYCKVKTQNRLPIDTRYLNACSLGNLNGVFGLLDSVNNGQVSHKKRVSHLLQHRCINHFLAAAIEVQAKGAFL